MTMGQNAGHFQVPGTDRHLSHEPRQDKTYVEYRKAWSDFPARFHTADFPLHLDLESTNMCNLRCEYCTRNEMQDGLGQMDFELFKKIIDEGSSCGLAAIKLNRRGEPLMHKELPRFVNYAKERGIVDVQFNTNAMLLTEELSRELIDAGLDRIIFSVDGIDPEVFERMRLGAKYETVVQNIKRFVEIRDKKKKGLPLTRVQMTTSEDNIQDVDEFIRIWQDVVNMISFNLIRAPMNTDNSPLGGSHSDKHYPCPQLWQRMAVYYNGDTVMCCGDWHKNYILGNAKDKSIQKMWLGERMQHARKIHKENRMSELSLCTECEYNIVRDLGSLSNVFDKF